MRDVLTTILIALLAAVVVALVFSIVDPIDEYSGVAGVITFIVVAIAGLTGKLRV